MIDTVFLLPSVGRAELAFGFGSNPIYKIILDQGLRDWLDANVSGWWCDHDKYLRIRVHFASEVDAILYRLAWA